MHPQLLNKKPENENDYVSAMIMQQQPPPRIADKHPSLMEVFSIDTFVDKVTLILITFYARYCVDGAVSSEPFEIAFDVIGELKRGH